MTVVRHIVVEGEIIEIRTKLVRMVASRRERPGGKPLETTTASCRPCAQLPVHSLLDSRLAILAQVVITNIKLCNSKRIIIQCVKQ